MKKPDISVIIVSYNVKNFVLECLKSIVEKTNDMAYEIILVDNASGDNTCQAVSENFSHVTVIKNRENLGFGKANNQGAQFAKGEFLLFLNPDTKILEKDTFFSLLSLLENNSSIGVLGCQLLNSNRTHQTSYGYFPSVSRIVFENIFSIYRFFENSLGLFREKPGATQTKEVDYVKGACLMISSVLFRKLEGFDEDFFMYSEERDLCYRVKEAGYRVVFDPSSQIIHYGEQSGGWLDVKLHKQLHKSQIIFMKKHYDKTQRYLIQTLLYLGILARFITWQLLHWLLPGNSEIKKRYKLFKELVWARNRCL